LAVITGDPDPRHISTSRSERIDITIWTSIRRFTRLTSGLPKKVENQSASVAFHNMQYNFARFDQTLRIPAAMAARVSDHVWSIEEIVIPSDTRGAVAA